MTRLAVVVEGETEEDFVSLVLVDVLSEHGIYPTARLPSAQGGNITVDRLAGEIVRLLPNFDFVTTLVDFYGFTRRPAETADGLEDAIRQAVVSRVSYSWDESLLIPYAQMHEFEALLFADVSAFRQVIDAGDSEVNRLAAIRSQFETPEDINDNYQTAPSKRIKQIIPSYSKRAYGPRIARSIGIDTLRSQCPRFAAWLTRLESLS